LNTKYPGSQTRKSSKAKLETLYSPNKGSPKVIKSHDSENSNNESKSSSKCLFGIHQTYCQEWKSCLMR
jgi:hypothetical protein